MTIDKSAVLLRLESLQPSEVIDAARAFLSDKNIRPATENPIRVKASDALALWTVRLKNTAITKRPIYGVTPLIARLETLRPSHDLEQMGFISRDKAGNLFFDGESGDFVGFVIVDRP